jgi:hypothetical protein
MVPLVLVLCQALCCQPDGLPAQDLDAALQEGNKVLHCNINNKRITLLDVALRPDAWVMPAFMASWCLCLLTSQAPHTSRKHRV